MKDENKAKAELIKELIELRKRIAPLEKLESDYNRREDALRESEDKYRTVVENAKEAIFVVQDEMIKYANPKAILMSGYTEKELKNRPFLEFLHPDDREIAIERYMKRVKGEKISKIQLYRIFDRDSNILWCEVSSVIITWEGEPAVLDFVNNITERKLAENALKESEEKYRTVVENAKEAVLVLQNGVIKFCNPKALDISGYTEEEFLLMPFVELVHTDDLEYVAKRYERIIDGEDLIDPNIYRVFNKDGSIRWVEGTGVSIVWEGNPATLSFFLDVTERELAREAHWELEDKFQNLFESSQDTLYFTSIEGRFVDINPAGEKLFGYTRDELLELNILDIYEDKKERDKFQKEIEGQGFVKDYEITFKRRDGATIDCSITSTIRKDRDGGVMGYQGIMKDVTDKKRMEAQIVQSQKMEAIGALAGGMAHNFNNILVGIMGYSEYLLSRVEEDAPEYKALKTIFDGTVRASELTGQLLNVARGEEFCPTKLYLNDVVRRVLPLISGTFDKSIEIKTDLDNSLEVIDGDIGQLEQCILNLCINARDAMPTGGKLIIETSNQSLDENFVRTHLGAQVGDYVILSVSDTGIGISHEVKEHIFEPFYTTKEHKGGTGMGLSTVYGIVKRHGGIVTVYSEVGEGSLFRLYFPVVSGNVEKSFSTKKKGESGGGEIILLIDDEPIVRDMWGDFLNDQGYRVIYAEDGGEGIKIFRENKDEIDLVILDFIMPGYGGGETFSRLKEIDPDVRVLLTSGYSENGRAGEVVEVGAMGFIQKPAQLTELAEKIREILNSE